MKYKELSKNSSFCSLIFNHQKIKKKQKRNSQFCIEKGGGVW